MVSVTEVGQKETFIWLQALRKPVPSKGPGRSIRTDGTLEQIYLRNKITSQQQIKSVRAGNEKKKIYIGSSTA